MRKYVIQWHHQRKEEGYTLIELLMVLAVLGILMMAIQTLLTTGVKVFHRGEAESEARRQLYYAAEQMIKAVRNTPASKITLSGSTPGVYDRLELVSSSGAVTRFYLQGNQLYREESTGSRIVADEIALLRFSVNCDVASGTFESYDPSTRRMTDLDTDFTTFDPGLKGMVVRLEAGSGTSIRYMYRKITNHGTNWIEFDSGFTTSFQPTTRNYAIGKTYQIYLKNLAIQRQQSGSEVTTGVTPRF